jgi:hypothetical protein
MKIKPVILAITALAAPAWALAACPTGTTLSLASTATSPRTDVDIQSKINSITSGVVNLTGNFNIAKTVVLKSCVSLQTPTINSPAVLTWTGGNGQMLLGEGQNDLSLSRLKLVGRGLSMGGNNVKVDQLAIVDPTRADPVNEPDLYVFKMIGGSNWTVTKNTFSINASRTDLAALNSTAIIGWGVDKATVTGNTFTRIKAGIHYQVLTNSNVSSNTGTDLTWAGIEIQGSANDTYKNAVTYNNFYNWLTNSFSMGLSLAGGAGYDARYNLVVRKGYSRSACASAKPAGTNEWGTWGMEFTGVNSTAYGNTFCGFDAGIIVGINAQGTFTGTDVSTVSNNTLINSNTGILTSYALTGTGISKQVVISGNSITDARNAAIADQVWWNESSHYQLGSAGMLDKLTIANNVIVRNASTTDAGLSYTAITAHPVKTASAVSITGNTISLAGTPATGFGYRGIFLDAYRDDQGVVVGQGSFAGSQVTGNAVSSAKQYGVGISTGTPVIGAGVAFKTNKFSWLQQAINTDLSQAIVSGNTCSNVANTSGCY